MFNNVKIIVIAGWKTGESKDIFYTLYSNSSSFILNINTDIIVPGDMG